MELEKPWKIFVRTRTRLSPVFRIWKQMLQKKVNSYRYTSWINMND